MSLSLQLVSFFVRAPPVGNGRGGQRRPASPVLLAPRSMITGSPEGQRMSPGLGPSATSVQRDRDVPLKQEGRRGVLRSLTRGAIATVRHGLPRLRLDTCRPLPCGCCARPVTETEHPAEETCKASELGPRSRRTDQTVLIRWTISTRPLTFPARWLARSVGWPSGTRLEAPGSAVPNGEVACSERCRDVEVSRSRITVGVRDAAARGSW